MATKKTNKRRKKGGRKLEFTIYIAGVLLVCLVVLGIVKGVRGLLGTDEVDPSSPSSAPSQSEVVSSLSSAISETASNIPSSDLEESSTEVSSNSEESTVSSDTPSSSAPVSSAASSKPAKKEDYINYTKTGVAELDEWYLLLVNPTNTISSSWSTDMTYLDSEYQLDSRIIEPYKAMVAAARADGVTLYPISCYRSYSTQQRLYNNRVDRAKRENPSFTQKEAEVYAATHVARPGTSEHQTGLAIDFNSVETDFGSTAAGKWLKQNANDYGFILRYEQDKQSKTNVTWEPWHYRFVGVKHAKRMTQLGYCLEEYIDYIKAGGQ
ncbi:MAG: M15 family metallopeptidase [Clostridia bacterium]|nr:M15 family metallopeptidase [Clostridia bacterium]